MPNHSGLLVLVTIVFAGIYSITLSPIYRPYPIYSYPLAISILQIYLAIYNMPSLTLYLQQTVFQVSFDTAQFYFGLPAFFPPFCLYSQHLIQSGNQGFVCLLQCLDVHNAALRFFCRLHRGNLKDCGIFLSQFIGHICHFSLGCRRLSRMIDTKSQYHLALP